MRLPAESLQVEFRMSSCCHKIAKIAKYVHPDHFSTFSNGTEVVHAPQARQIVHVPCLAQYNLIVSDFLCQHKNIQNVLAISLGGCSEVSSQADTLGKNYSHTVSKHEPQTRWISHHQKALVTVSAR